MKAALVPTKELPGVYAMVHTKTGETYVGATTGPISVRWRAHRSALNGWKAHNAHLQAAWNKSGLGAFEFLVLENVEPPESVFEHEQAWIDMMRLAGVPLYNQNLTVDTPYMLGRTHTPEARAKISAAHTGRKHTPEACENMRKAHVGNKSRTGQTRSEAERQKGSASLKRAYAEGRRRTISYPAFRNRTTGETIPAGQNFSAMCKKHGLSRRGMDYVRRGERKSYHGWEVLR